MIRSLPSALTRGDRQARGRRHKLTFGLVSLVTLFSLFALAMQGEIVRAQEDTPSEPAVATSWSIQRVNPQKLFLEMGTRSLQIGSDGKASVAYGGDHLYYARRVGSGGNCGPGLTWSCEVADSADNVGLYASLSLDAANNPHIVYFDATNGALKYAYKSGGGWFQTTLDDAALALNAAAEQEGVAAPEIVARDWRSADLAENEIFGGLSPMVSSELRGAGLYPAIKVNGDGDAFVAYYDSTSGDLKFTHSTAGYWTPPMVVDGSDLITETVGLYPSLDLVGNYVLISYYNAAKGNLKLAKSSGDFHSWDKQNLDETGDVGQFTSIVAYGSDKYAISYYDASNKDLKYIEGTISAKGTPVVVDSGGEVGKYSSLAIVSGNPRISYFDEANSDLKYAVRNSGTWSSQKVYGDGLAVGRYTSLGTLNGRARISFYDKSHGYLAYAIQSDSQDTNWTIEAVDNSFDEGMFSSLVYDSANNPHISFFDDIHDRLNYASWNGSSWSVQVADGSGAAGLYSHLVLDSSNRPHISYWDAGNRRIKYAYYDGSSWKSEYVPTDPNSPAGEASALALGSDGLPWIVYYDAANKDVELTQKTSSTTWRTTPILVDGDYDAGLYLSMVLDTSVSPNVAHISYYTRNGNVGSLHYAKCPPYPCTLQTVDSGQFSDIGLFNSIALDQLKRPHIAYMNNDNDTLKHAVWNGTYWATETVDNTYGAGFYPSLALTQAGNPLIAYYDYINRNLKYAAWTGVSWDIQVVDSAGEVGMYPSIDLTSTDHVGISYYDASNGDLKFAATTPPVVIVFDHFIFLPVITR